MNEPYPTHRSHNQKVLFATLVASLVVPHAASACWEADADAVHTRCINETVIITVANRNIWKMQNFELKVR